MSTTVRDVRVIAVSNRTDNDTRLRVRGMDCNSNNFSPSNDRFVPPYTDELGIRPRLAQTYRNTIVNIVSWSPSVLTGSRIFVSGNWRGRSIHVCVLLVVFVSMFRNYCCRLFRDWKRISSLLIIFRSVNDERIYTREFYNVMIKKLHLEKHLYCRKLCKYL